VALLDPNDPTGQEVEVEVEVEVEAMKQYWARGHTQQMLVTIIVAPIKHGQTVEIERIIPDELQQRLAKTQ
jgi:hypothetical protein